MAAIELARRGVAPRVVDQNQQPHLQTRATNIQAATMYALHQQGTFPDFRSFATELELIEFRNRHWDLLDLIDLRAATGEFNYTLALPQWRTEAILTQRAHELGVEVTRGVTVTDMTIRSDCTEVTLAGPEGTFRASHAHVIDAGGAHSPTRRALGHTLIGDEYEKRFIDAEVVIETPFERNRIVRIPGPHGSVIWVPMPEGRSMLIFDIERESPVANPEHDIRPQDLQALLAQVVDGNFNLTEVIRASCFTLHHRIAEHFGDSHRHLIGDAGHLQSLFSGMGMNVGMQDAHNLSWKLAMVLRGTAQPRLLSTYEAERRPAALLSLAASDSVYHQVVDGVDPETASTSIEDAALMLDVSYSSGPLSLDGGIYADDVFAAGRLLRSTALVYADKLVLIATHPTPELRAVTQRWANVVDTKQSAPPTWPTQLVGLVRPDGYLGFIWDSADLNCPAALHSYLSAWFIQ